VSTVLLRARVIVGDGSEVEDASVKLDGGRIVAIRQGGALKGDYAIDLEGRTVMPGLIDVHVHMTGGDGVLLLGEPVGFDFGASLKMADPLPKAVLDSVEAARVTLHAGITTVRELGGREYIDVFVKRAQQTGQIDGPRMLTAGPGLFMTGGHGSFLEPGHEADGPSGVVRRVRELIANGVDVIKIFSTQGPEASGDWLTTQYTLAELEAAVTEAHRLSRRTAAHVLGEEGLDNALSAGVDTIEHGWYLSETHCHLMRERGTYLVPTLGVLVNTSRQQAAFDLPNVSKSADGDAEVFARVQQAIAMGVRIAMGSDCGGIITHKNGANAEELGYYVECGMSPMEAIQSGTLEAARALALHGEIGSLEEGKIADLLILDDDPLRDIGSTQSALVGVIQGGAVRRDDLGLLTPLRRDPDAQSNFYLVPDVN
jgi:imidazolonepropionase-like amidohydrolase